MGQSAKNLFRPTIVKSSQLLTKLQERAQMTYNFNAKEVFEMAIRIEENGAAFYRKAAELQENPSDKEFLETLARVEERHKLSFETIQEEISEMEKSRTVFDPEEELSLYLKAMADSHGGEGNPDIMDLFDGRETMEEVITTAIDLEKESILFYLGLKDIVPPRRGQERIDKIITEEKQHIVQLKEFLQIAKKTAPKK
jgi:rubrerythrin